MLRQSNRVLKIQCKPFKLLSKPRVGNAGRGSVQYGYRETGDSDKAVGSLELTLSQPSQTLWETRDNSDEGWSPLDFWLNNTQHNVSMNIKKLHTREMVHFHELW